MPARTPTDFYTPPWTVREAITVFVISARIGPLLRHRYQPWEEVLEPFIERFENRLAKDLTAEEVEDFLDGRVRSGLPPSPRLALQIMFRWIAREGGEKASVATLAG